MDKTNVKNTEADSIKIRPADPSDYDYILRLNEESVHFLAPLSREELTHLHEQAEILSVLEVDGSVEAFVLALREGKNYDSINYSWFLTHYPSFLYVDRVVVSSNMQGKGLGRILYQEVFRHASETLVPCVTAEIDIEPPNPASLKFHENFGFLEVGKQAVAGGKKMVSLQVSVIAQNS